jgi:uncharacterized protein (TIGR02594 family)
MNKLLEIALTQVGISELPGLEKNNPEIMKYFEGLGNIYNDETAWCSAFINWCAMTVRLEHSKRLNARSWLKIGMPIDYPALGDVVIFWRESPDSWKGHVGIFISKIGDKIYTLGGNQNNSVCIMPYKASQLLGYRTLR